MICTIIFLFMHFVIKYVRSPCIKIVVTACCCLPTPMTLASGGESDVPTCGLLASFSVQSLRRGLYTNPGVTGWCVCGCSWRDDVCHVCGCYRGCIVVMDVFWRQLCVSMIWGREICLFWVGQGCDEWGGEVSLQSCQCVVEVCTVFCYCLLWLDA